MSFTAREAAWNVHSCTAGLSRHPGVAGGSLAAFLEGVRESLRGARRRYAAAVGTPRVLLSEPDDAMLAGWDAEAVRELEHVDARLATLVKP